MVKLFDLSHPVSDGQSCYPGDPPIEVKVARDYDELGYRLRRIHFSTHAGTHLDAPSHFFPDGTSVDRIPLNKLFGDAFCIDLAPGTLLPQFFEITPAILEPYSHFFEPRAKILLRTGWDRRFGAFDYHENHPGLTPEAARWIAERKIDLLGVDLPSPSCQWRIVHEILLAPGNEIVLLENLSALDLLPERFILAAFPLKVSPGDGAPVRAVAIIEE